MLPTGTSTERTRFLQSIADAANEGEFINWPEPTHEDYALVGKVVAVFGYIDLHLRRMAEIFELAKKLAKPIKGKVSELRIGEVEDLLLADPELSAPNRIAFLNMKELRKVRNMLAHFALKRFPNEAAFLCFTKSARDYRKEFGVEPRPGVIFTAVLDVSEVQRGLTELMKVHTWLAQATMQLEDAFFAALKRAGGL